MAKTLNPSWYKNPFVVDLRSLAFFRVFLGLVIIWDLGLRFYNLEAFHGNNGLISVYSAAWYGFFSMHFASGSLWFQGFMLFVHGIIALLFIFGYKTRFFTFLLWLFTFSLINRNIYITQSSDDLIVLLLMWSIFLPLGARYSIDAALNKHEIKSNNFLSIATFAILTQAMYVYFFGAWLKTDYQPWRDGMAVYQIFHWQGYGSPLATKYLAELPMWLYKFSTHFVYHLEFIGPLLILLPLKNLTLRVSVLSLMVLMHTGFIFFMGVGAYPFISFASLSLFIPGVFWDKLEKKLSTNEKKKISIYYDEDCGFCYKTCLIFRMLCLPSSVKILPAQKSKKYGPILKKNNSWVVVDSKGKVYIKWEAVTFILSKSPVLWPFALIFRTKITAMFGDWLYKKIATNRPGLGSITKVYLPLHNTDYKISKLSVAFIAFMFTANLAFNLTDHIKIPFQKELDTFADRMKFRKWVMFMNMPPTSQQWFEIQGQTVNNKTVDAWGLKETPTFGKRPEHLYYENPNYRYRKYFQQMYYTYAKADFGNFICHRWNKEFPNDKLVRITFNLHWENYDYFIKPVSQDKRLEFKYNCQKKTFE